MTEIEWLEQISGQLDDLAFIGQAIVVGLGFLFAATLWRLTVLAKGQRRLW